MAYEALLRDYAAGNGIDAIGWFRPDGFPEYLRAIRQRGSQYAFRYRSMEQFIAAARVDARYQSVIVLVKDYFVERAAFAEGYRLSNYSRFCWQTLGPTTNRALDYIRSLGFLAEQVDIPQRAGACLAGLGFIGRNCMFYAHGIGSYVGIAAIGTDMPLRWEDGAEQVADDRCAGCGACVRACPTGAILEAGYAIDPRKCVSFCNRHPEEPSKVLPADSAALRRWLLGCEECQDCCPINRQAHHRADVVREESLRLFGMEVPNRAVIEASLLAGQIGQINDRDYRDYVNRLLG